MGKTLVNVFFTIIVVIITLIPLWVACGLWWWLEPSTFMEKLALLVVCGIALGSVQVWAGIFGLSFLAALWLA